jgi:rhamnogalacturonyl hydrolase YesR
MKYHKENLHCVYLFKEAQKCYAKLASSYEKIQNWLTTSGLFVSDVNDKNCGGVHSFYDEKENQYGFLYPEITGYFISCMRFLNNQQHEEIFSQYAKYSSDWLIKIYEEYGAIVQGINSNSKNNFSYSFDSAICAKGLLDCYELNNEKKYLDYGEQIMNDLIAEAIGSDGSVKPFKDISTNKYQESNQVWYKQEGCFHIKTSIPFFQLYKITNDEKQLKIGEKICKKIDIYQNSDGSIKLHANSKLINLHTLCYALEGLLYGFYVTNNEEYHNRCERAVDWCLNQINDDGSISLWFNSKYKSKAAYPISQLIRILILLDKINNNSKYKPQTKVLYEFLKTLHGLNSNPKINGGFYEEYYKSLFGWKKRMRLNSWTTMFALQGISWLENYENITFENAIKYLY